MISFKLKLNVFATAIHGNHISSIVKAFQQHLGALKPNRCKRSSKLMRKYGLSIFFVDSSSTVDGYINVIAKINELLCVKFNMM